ncbi:MAG TPA: hypothetical protein PKJ16_06890 [Spirochaetota bacterium]|nr:hypothetical protein [Spirochaetota bacterium]HPU87731.1 hypothetical protein [Spirochaetota bacterium]
MKKRTSIRRLAILLFLAMIMGASFTCYKDEMDFQTNESNTNSAKRFIQITSNPVSGFTKGGNDGHLYLGNQNLAATTPINRSLAQSFTIPSGTDDTDMYVTGVWVMLRRYDDVTWPFLYDDVTKKGDVVTALIYTNSGGVPGSLLTSSPGAFIARVSSGSVTYPGDMVAFTFSSRPRLAKGQTYWVVFEITWQGDTANPKPVNNRYVNYNTYLDFHVTDGNDTQGEMAWRNYNAGAWDKTGMTNDIIMWVDGITAN